MEYKKGEIIGIEPLTLAETASALYIDYYQEEEIQRLIKAARESAEDYCNIDFVQKTYSIFANRMPYIFECEKYPLKEITAAEAYTVYGQIDITADFEIVSGNGILYKNNISVGELRGYDNYKLTVTVGLDSVSDRVKEAMLWYCYNTYHKIEVGEWLPQFRNLLSDIRRRSA